MVSTGARPRLADVAARAGVSEKTVSNVVNDFHQVSERTRSAVLAAIDELGYRPNLTARNLARGRTGTIALVVPRLEMPYFAALAGRVLEAAAARGWFVLIQETGSAAPAELDALEARFPQRIDGILLAAEQLEEAQLRARVDATPLVLLGTGPQVEGTPRLSLDDEAAATQAVGHLLERGRRRIAMIGAAADDGRHPRLAGYRRALEGADLPVDPALIAPVSGNIGEEGERACEEMLARCAEAAAPLPDALFATTDWVALGALRSLRRHGLAVPRDVAVIGFDDIPYARVATPSLSTISPDRAQIAQQALSLLEQQMSTGSAAGAEPEPVAYELIVRESTGG